MSAHTTQCGSIAGPILVLCWAGFVLASQIGQAAPQVTSEVGANEKQSLEQLEQAAAAYEKFLSGPLPAGTPQSAIVEARAHLGTAYFLLHRYQDSLNALKPLLSENPPHGTTSRNAPGQSPTTSALLAQSWLVSGLDYLETNQVADALPSLRRALAMDPKSGNARMGLGDALARSGHMDEAEKQYEEQTRQTPSSPDAWYKLGLVHWQLAESSLSYSKQFQGGVVGRQLAAEGSMATDDNWNAAKILSQLVREAPNQPEVHAGLGTAQLGLGHQKSASEEFRRELSLDPLSPSALLGLAQVAALAGNWEEANSELEHLAHTHPRHLTRRLASAPAGLLLQGWANGRIKIPETIADTPVGLLWKAWLSNSDSAPGLVPSIAETPAKCTVPSTALLGKANLSPGMWLSEACYQKLRQTLSTKAPLSLAQRIKLAEADFRLGKYRDTVQDVRLVLKANPTSDWGAYWLSKVHDRLAEECFVRVGELNPASVRVHQILAEHYLQWQNYPKAEAEYSAAIKLDPKLPDLHLGLGTIYSQTGDLPHAIEELKRTLELTPGSAAAHAQLGAAYVHQGEWPSAIAELRQVPGDSPSALNARINLAKAEDEVGETTQAVKDLEQLSSMDQDGEIHYRLAGLYRKLGDSVHAQEALRDFQRLRAASAQPDESESDASPTDADKRDMDRDELPDTAKQH